MSEWRDTTLGDICKINMGQSPKSEHYNYEKQGLPFCKEIELLVQNIQLLIHIQIFLYR